MPVHPHWDQTSHPELYNRSATKYHRIKIADLVSRGMVSKHVFGLLDNLPYGTFIAGGFVSSFFSGKEPGDIDFYFDGPESFEKTLKYWMDLGYKPNKSLEDIESAATPVVNLTKEDAIKIQLMKINWCPEVENVIDFFDFTVCQFAIERDEIIYNPLGLVDLMKNELKVHRISCHEDVMYRVLKYQKKGFNVSAETMDQLTQEIQRQPLNAQNQSPVRRRNRPQTPSTVGGVAPSTGVNIYRNERLRSNSSILASTLDLEVAHGAALDRLGALVNIIRTELESDSTYRMRVAAAHGAPLFPAALCTPWRGNPAPVTAPQPTFAQRITSLFRGQAADAPIPPLQHLTPEAPPVAAPLVNIRNNGETTGVIRGETGVLIAETGRTPAYIDAHVSETNSSTDNSRILQQAINDAHRHCVPEVRVPRGEYSFIGITIPTGIRITGTPNSSYRFSGPTPRFESSFRPLVCQHNGVMTGYIDDQHVYYPIPDAVRPPEGSLTFYLPTDPLRYAGTGYNTSIVEEAIEACRRESIHWLRLPTFPFALDPQRVVRACDGYELTFWS